MAELEPVPGPPGIPILGNLGQIDRYAPTTTFVKFAEEYGEFYRLLLPGRSLHVASSVRLIEELCDERRFEKNPQGALGEVRNAVHDGLFTARPHEKNWGIAHRVLTPAFGTLPIRDMYDEMYDIAAQMTMKWARLGGDAPIAVTDDFTRLTLDTLALCSMGFRFNSFYRLDLHPFLFAMNAFLHDCGRRPGRLPIEWLKPWLYAEEDKKYFSYVETMRSVADEVIKKRKDGHDADRNDLLKAMLEGVDRKTGRKMTEQSIADNLITFLVAGHETTSGMMSFTMYQLLRNPRAYKKLQDEIDTVIGDRRITVEDMSKLPYTMAVLREALRLNAPIAQFVVEAKEDTIMGGKWALKKGDPVTLLLAKSHLDPAVYGDDALEFKPERMLDENFNKLPHTAWKPFGNGTRGCIGRPFAIQEAKLGIAMMFQHFDFVMDDPNYELKVKQNLTLKPDNFKVRAIPRKGRSARDIEKMLCTPVAPPKKAARSAGSAKAGDDAAAAGRPMTVLFGGNGGTCECLAKKIAANAAAHGFNARVVDVLDDHVGKLPKNGKEPVIMVTTSYEGQPADNAAEFVPWLESLPAGALEGVEYSVFGCGHHEWIATFHRIPKLVDAKMAAAGARRLAPMGLTDVAEDNVFTDFETWEDDTLWPALQARYGVDAAKETNPAAATLDVNITRARPLAHHSDYTEDSVVVSSRTLTTTTPPTNDDKSTTTTHHMEIRLPPTVTYKPGDHLAILPFNADADVARALRRFGLSWDATVTIHGAMRTQFPTGVPVSARELLASRVELRQPATRRNVLMLAASVPQGEDAAARDALQRMAVSLQQKKPTEGGEEQSSRPSVLELLERYPSADISFGAFLAMLPLMRKRQYCVSSSPAARPEDPRVASITFSTVSSSQSSSSPSSKSSSSHLGVASHYLTSLSVGDKLGVAVRRPHSTFSLPEDPASTPIIMVSSGAGIAPFRAFVQERMAMLKNSSSSSSSSPSSDLLAPALLVHGCGAAGADDLYASELSEAERAGAVVVLRAYAATPELSSGGCKAATVQQLLVAERETLMELWRQGAKLYVCGDRALGRSVRDMAVGYKLRVSERNSVAMTREEGLAWWEELRGSRHVTDVFD